MTVQSTKELVEYWLQNGIGMGRIHTSLGQVITVSYVSYVADEFMQCSGFILEGPGSDMYLQEITIWYSQIVVMQHGRS